jgi:alanyl-tRNA synthetase
VTGEGAVASGVRRIEALTGRHARKHANDTITLAKAAAQELRTTPEDVPVRIAALMENSKKLERELSDARKKLAMGGGTATTAATPPSIVSVNGTNFYPLRVNGLATNDLRGLVDEGKRKIKSGVVAVANTAADGKLAIVIGVTDDLVGRFNAGHLVKKTSEKFGGRGGGKPDFAQGGGPDGSKADEALDAIKQEISA